MKQAGCINHQADSMCAGLVPYLSCNTLVLCMHFIHLHACVVCVCVCGVCVCVLPLQEAAKRAAQAAAAEEKRKAVAEAAERHHEEVKAKLEGKLARVTPRFVSLGLHATAAVACSATGNWLFQCGGHAVHECCC